MCAWNCYVALVVHSAPPLDAFVDALWICNDATPHARERVLPNGTLELVINLRENEFRIYDPLHHDRFARYSGAMVSGPYDRYFMIDPAQHASIIGVHFKPGGAFPFFALPAKELASMHVDLDTLWGARARELACHIGLSERRFIQLFSAEVGLTPKLFLSRSAFSASPQARRATLDRRLGRARHRLRILRSGTHDSRLRRSVGIEPVELSPAAERRRPPLPRAAHPLEVSFFQYDRPWFAAEPVSCPL